MTRTELRARLLTAFGDENPSTAVSNYINSCLDRSLEEIARTADTAPWLRKHFSFITTPQVDSSTAASAITLAVGGSPVMTAGSDLRLDRRHIGAYLRIDGESETYLIKEVTRNSNGTGTTTTIVVDPPYSGVAFGTQVTSGLNATVTQINYRLPPDCLNVYGVKQSTFPLKLWSGDPAQLDAAVPDPIILGQTGDPWMYCVVQGGWLPDFWGSKAQRAAGFDTASDIGTIDFTNGSIFVDESTYGEANLNAHVVLATNRSGDNVIANSLVQGRFLRMTGDPRWYRISDIRLISGGEGTSNALYRLVLDEPFQGTTTSNAEFTIDGSDAGPWMRFYPIPTARMNIHVEYHAMPPILQGSNEEPRIPEHLHGVLLDGALAKLYSYMKDERTGTQERKYQEGLIRTIRAQNMSQEKRRSFHPTPTLDGSQYPDTIGMWPVSIET